MAITQLLPGTLLGSRQLGTHLLNRLYASTCVPQRKLLSHQPLPCNTPLAQTAAGLQLSAHSAGVTPGGAFPWVVDLCSSDWLVLPTEATGFGSMEQVAARLEHCEALRSLQEHQVLLSAAAGACTVPPVPHDQVGCTCATAVAQGPSGRLAGRCVWHRCSTQSLALQWIPAGLGMHMHAHIMVPAAPHREGHIRRAVCRGSWPTGRAQIALPLWTEHLAAGGA